MVGAVLAEGTAAGTDISNTATATYTDGTNTFNATSNTVVIRVAEIAGLTVVASPVQDADGGAIEAGDDLTYSFTVTNVGNAETNVFISDISGFLLENFTADGPVEIYAADGTTLLATINPGDGGLTLGEAGSGSDPIQPDESFIVKVTGTPTVGTQAGDSVSVTIGDTDDTIAPEGVDPTQNQPATTDTNDLRTVNVPGSDAPQNGEREAQATGTATFASSVQPLALATVLKTNSGINVGDPSNPQDDLITYDLGLRVENTSPSNLFQPAALEGTNISLTTASGIATVKRILVSDAIPAGTQLQSVSTALPAGWTAVYSTNTTANDPLDPSMAWTTIAPTDLSTVTRVGFISSGPIGATGTTLTGLRFTVVSNGVDPTGGTVANIAQVFGQTLGDPAAQIIYDESGDSNPNNFNDDGSLPPTDVDQSGSQYTPGVDTGIADPAVDGTDNGNNNTGQGPDGEVNVVVLTPTTDDILNGTQNTPNAIGPTSDNDDFTNQSTPTPPAGTSPTDTFNPDAITFNNTLSNPAASGFIADVTIEPIAPSVAEAAGGVAGAYGLDGDIPDGTVVTISYNGASAAYTYTAAAGFTINAGNTPVNVGDVLAGAQVDYTVTVDLPDGTDQLVGISIPIIVFPEDNPATPGYTGEVTNNITIDRAYTGFMSLLKEARVLLPDGTLKSGLDFSATPPQAAPGEFIEYRITYTNISEPALGQGSVALTANNFVLTEAGDRTFGPFDPSDPNTPAPDNNWALFTTHQQNTVATDGSVEYFTNSGDATAVSTTDPAGGTIIGKYVNSVGNVLPEDFGSLTFRRVVD